MSYFFVALTIAFTVYGQVVLKWQMSTYGADLDVNKPFSIFFIFLKPWVISAFCAAFLASLSWMMPMGGFPAYATSKAAVHGLTRNMARDLGPHRIRVNTVVPGWIMTERQKELWLTPEAMEAHRDRQCLKDMIEPVYVARMAVFLASDDAAMCTAQNFMVEGGSI